MRIGLEGRPRHLPQRGDFGFLPGAIVNATTLPGRARLHSSAIDFDARDLDRCLVRGLPFAMLLQRRVVPALRRQLVTDLLGDPQDLHRADLQPRQLEQPACGLLRGPMTPSGEDDLVDDRRGVLPLINLQHHSLREKKTCHTARSDRPARPR